MTGSNVLSVVMFSLGVGLVVFAIRFFAHSMRGAFDENVQRSPSRDHYILNKERFMKQKTNADATSCASNCYASIDDAITIANGCLDYGGGYRGTPELEIYHHGIQTVVTALKAAKRNGRSGTQVNALVMMGESVYKDA